MGCDQGFGHRPLEIGFGLPVKGCAHKVVASRVADIESQLRIQQRKIDQIGSQSLSLFHGWSCRERFDFQLLNRSLGLNPERENFTRRVATNNGKGQHEGCGDSKADRAELGHFLSASKGRDQAGEILQAATARTAGGHVVACVFRARSRRDTEQGTARARAPPLGSRPSGRSPCGFKSLLGHYS